MVRETKFYDLLEVPPTASEAEIKKAYRKLAVKTHPDKGGDPEEFKAITHAYEALSDPEKRALYDQHGEEGLEEGGVGFHSAEDIFSSLFGGGMFGGGGGGGGGRSRGPARGENVTHALGVTLENLYNGKDTRFAVTKKVLCGKCSGSGSKTTKGSTTCKTCKGRGVRIITRQLGIMIQQMQTTCSDCGGQGSVIPEGDRCDECKGQKVVSERKTLELHIERGMRDGQRITFSGEADQSPDTVPGDIVFVLQQRDHDTFVRKGDDLLITRTIPLVDALCGCHISITHLDGRVISIKTPPNTIIKPGDVMSVEHEGMPLHRSPFEKGRLFVKFEIAFPDTLDKETTQSLESVLPARSRARVPADAEEAFLVPSDLSLMGSGAGAGGRHAHDSDDEDEGGGQRVHCAQQ